MRWWPSHSVRRVWSSLGLAWLTALATAEATTTTLPNVLFILIDDAGWADIGYQNESPGWQSVTPNLNRYAYDGIRLTNHYSEVQCTPSRAALMTGMYSINVGMSLGTLLATQGYGLPLEHKLLPQYFREAGYSTHHIGKWNLGVIEPAMLPTARGFDTSFGYMNAYEEYYTHRMGVAAPHDLLEGNSTHYWAARHHEGKYSTHLFTDVAMGRIGGLAEFGEQPWFMYLSYQAVHSPETTSGNTSAWAGMPHPGRRKVANMMHNADQQIARLLNFLNTTGQLDHTYVVVTSDNGGCKIEGQNNHPLRGLKDTPYEGGTKSFAFVYSPSLPESLRGAEYAGLMHISDWVPTLTRGLVAGSMDLRMHNSNGTLLDSYNQWPAILGLMDPPRTDMMYWLSGYNLEWSEDDNADIAVRSHRLQGAYRRGPMKVLLNTPCMGWYNMDSQTVIDSLTYVVCPADEYSTVCAQLGVNYMTDYLFNLSSDPLERVNLAHRHPDILAELMLAMHEVYAASPLPAYRHDTGASESHWKTAWREAGFWVVPWENLSNSSIEYVETLP